MVFAFAANIHIPVIPEEQKHYGEYEVKLKQFLTSIP